MSAIEEQFVAHSALHGRLGVHPMSGMRGQLIMLLILHGFAPIGRRDGGIQRGEFACWRYASGGYGTDEGGHAETAYWPRHSVLAYLARRAGVQW